MFCKSISWFICIYVAAAIASDYSDSHSITGSNPEVKVYDLSTDNLEASRVGPVQEAQETAAADLEPPADTSSAPASVPHSVRRRAAASAASSTALCPKPAADDPIVCDLRKLSAEEKGRKLRKTAEKGDVSQLQRLLAAGTDVEASSALGNTALHSAAGMGRLEVARCLLASGALVDSKNMWQMTPLHMAAWNGFAAVVQLLTASGADPNARDDTGKTPLHQAAYKGWADSVTALLEAGACRAATTNEGHTPLYMARQQNHQQLIDMLRLTCLC